MIRVFSLLLILPLLQCMSSLHQFHSSDPIQFQSLDQQRKIVAESEQFVFLGFAFDTLYIDEAMEELRSKCTKGTIDRIDTVFKTNLGFLSWRNQIRITGYCTESGKSRKMVTFNSDFFGISGLQ